jgi:hypothetical protein
VLSFRASPTRRPRPGAARMVSDGVKPEEPATVGGICSTEATRVLLGRLARANRSCSRSIDPAQSVQRGTGAGPKARRVHAT